MLALCKEELETERQLLTKERQGVAEWEREMERRMRESHPQAESLALTYAHLLGASYEDMSIGQLSALQQIHAREEERLRAAIEELIIRQERALIEERNALLRELISLRAQLSQP